jgi:DNA-binding protein YbaB
MVSDATMSWYRDLVSDTQKRLGSLGQLQQDPERFRGRVELREGIVAEAAPGGTPVGLTLSPGALRLGPEVLADLILKALRQAGDEANRRYAAAVDDATGGAADVTGLLERRIDERRIREAASELNEAQGPLRGQW